LAPFQAGNNCKISFELRFEPFFCRFDGSKHCVEVLFCRFDGSKHCVEVLLQRFDGSKCWVEVLPGRFDGSKYWVEGFERLRQEGNGKCGNKDRIFVERDKRV